MGNKLGWILAGIFGAFVIILIVVVVFFPSPTAPTSATTKRGMLTLQKPAEPLTTILPSAPDGEGNAADDYRRALKLYKDNNEALKGIFKHYTAVAKDEYRLTDDDVALLNSIAKPLATGAAKKTMTYYSPEKMDIPYWPEESSQFQSLADIPQMLFIHHAGKGEVGYPAAEKCLFDMLVLGRHLVEERARLDIVRTGSGIQRVACELLGQLYSKWGKPDRARAATDYRLGLRDLSGIYADLNNDAIWQLRQHTSGALEGPNPGDIFNLVANHADRAVRVEAILGLGVVKLTCTSRGDHKRVRKLIDEKLASDDPIEKAAAKCADALDAKGLIRLASAK